MERMPPHGVHMQISNGMMRQHKPIAVNLRYSFSFRELLFLLSHDRESEEEVYKG